MLTKNQLAPSLHTPDGVFSKKIDDRILFVQTSQHTLLSYCMSV